MTNLRYSLPGNVMVITVVTYVRSMRSSTNCYLVSLAIADLLTLISATLPFIIDFFYLEDEWVYGCVKTERERERERESS